MSRHVRSRSKSMQRDDLESNQQAAPVIPSDEQPQQEKTPTESQDIIPNHKEENEGAPVVQGPDLGADLQKLAPPKTCSKGRAGPNVKRASLLNLEPIKMPEAGMLSIKNAKYVV
ncbi:putative G antigen family E member 3 [Panthera pardus]|uniref:G antigen family E member 3 n=1 Tax=Panthera pardus TaxID=9691 RepID=A0A9V1F4H3_PANPR|nr:putative G antigen family E member 3 [Panthera pardus]